MANAANSLEVSPALWSYPGDLLRTLKACTTKDHLFGSRSHAVDHLEAWFKSLQNPAYTHVLTEEGSSLGDQSISALNHAHARVDSVRKLVDYRTEQALISMIDAAVQRYGNGPECQYAASRMLLRIAAQRDRAWTWAEAVDRFLDKSEDRLETEIGAMNVAETLHRVERSYDQFERYRK